MKLFCIFFLLLNLNLVLGNIWEIKIRELCEPETSTFTLVFRREHNAGVAIESLDLSIIKIENLLFDVQNNISDENNLDPDKISKRIADKLSDNKLETYLNLLAIRGYKLIKFTQLNENYVATFIICKRGYRTQSEQEYWSDIYAMRYPEISDYSCHLTYQYSIDLLKTFDHKTPLFIFRSLGEQKDLYGIYQKMECQ